ncbi:MAG: exodeoxyribonuclease VII large subunit [Candidatus Saccharimonadales bacterium]
MDDVTLGVSDAIDLINQTLDEAYPFILVEGEVASFKVNQGKFVFFDVKDEAASLGCFMMAFALKFPLQDGMKVRISAQPKLTQWGKFSLTVREVMPVGEGSLKKSFELLKAKLVAEGLFDEGRKRLLPKIPRRIGVVSSSQAAGYADFIKILDNRWGDLQIVLADCAVQGVEAPAQLIGALKHLNELAEPLDVIAVIRGGGSADDLAAFNHEDVVRAVAASRAPTITGVGHEVDVTLADLAADLRAATPSNAAELLVPSKHQVFEKVERLTSMAHNGVTAAIRVFVEDREVVQDGIEKSLQTFFSQLEGRLLLMNQTLLQLNPEVVLRRGYGLVKKDEQIISSASAVILDDELNIQLKDGVIGARVTDVRK